MSKPSTLGLIATYKSGISTLRGAGQDVRFVRYYLHHYVGAFDRVYYFSYLDERLEDYTDDTTILAKVCLLPKKWPRMPAWLYAWLLPIAYGPEYAECNVFRVFQTIGIFPLWRSLWRRTPCLVGYGYQYSAFARVQGKPWWKVAMTRLVEIGALRVATLTLVTTPELYRFVQGSRKLKPIALIPNGVDTQAFAAVRERVSLGVGSKTLLFVGRLEKQKNLETLLRAAAQAMEKVPLRLLWIGQGSQETMLRRLAVQLRVDLEIRPPVPHTELPSIMRVADLFTLVSWTEGHPKILLEAMSMALPCVVSRIEATQSLIADGSSGLFCDPADATSIAAAIIRLLQDPTLAKILGDGARRQVQTRFDLNAWVSHETRLLKKLALKDPVMLPVSIRGTPVTRWLDYSCRRRLLDRNLAEESWQLGGDVLEVGGGREIRRGRFLRPIWQTVSWTSLNKDPQCAPDIVADVQSLPLGDSSVDHVFCLETLEYVESPLLAVREMARVLRSGGLLWLSVPSMHSKDHAQDRWRFTELELRSLIESSSLRLIRLHKQGGRCAGLAHLLKSIASRTHSSWLRQILGLLLFFPVEGLICSDRFVRWLGIEGSKTTGYLLIALMET
jgi:glycosyltransferase involved in cell wall biosynthesis